MKKFCCLMVGILLLTSLNAFAESAASEDGVLDYSIFENDPAYAFEIDRFDKTWTASVEVTGDASSLSMLMSVMGNLDGEVHFFALGLPYSTECEKVQFLIDETVYSFDLSLVTDALYLAIIFLTPDTYAFFEALSSADMVEMRATVNGREIEDAITGEQMENLRRFADGFCSQDVLNYFSDMGETYWIAFNGLNAMTVD